MNGSDHIALDGGGGDDNSVDFSRLGSMDVRLNRDVMTDITNIQTLIGGGAGFTIGVVDGNSRWELDGEYSGVLLHDSSGDESFDAEYTFINFVELIGGSGVATLVADDVDNHWTLNSSDGGTLESRYSETEGEPAAQLTFSGMDRLIGGTEKDHFVLSGAAFFSGTLDGGEGVGRSLASKFNTGNWALTENYDGTLTVNQNALHFYNMQTLEGSGSDSLKGLSQKNVWHWSPEGGSVALDEPDAPDSFAIDFSGMNRLIGGGVADRLNSETDNGKWVMTEPHKGTLTVSGDELRFEDMQTLAGSGTDTLNRHEENNHWLITSTNGGMLLESDENGAGWIENGNTTYFSGMNALIGGSNSDHFAFGSDGAITGRIDGGGTDDGVINTIVGRDTDNYWEIGVADGAQRGSITDVTDTDDDPIGFTYLKEFTGIHSLVGGDGTDQFVYMEGGQHIALDGGGGDDNSVDFSRLGSMDVRLNIGPMADITNIQTLIGGGAGFTIGVVDGNSRWELDGEYSGVLLHDSSGDESFDAEYTFINFVELIGGSGVATLVADDVDNHWTLNSSDGGTLESRYSETEGEPAAQLTFSGMDRLIGGTEKDHFVLSGAEFFRGTLDGGEGVGNSLASEFNNGNWALTENYDGTLTVNQNALHFYNMQTLEGSGSDSLKGLSQKNVWHWSPEGGSVALDEPDAPDSFAIDFSGMNRLIGGGVADRLNSETDNGKWVMTEPHKGTLTVSGDELRFEDMQTLAGSGTDTLNRHEENNHWLITSTNGGMLLESDENGAGWIENGNTTYFSGMNALIGGSNSDHFAFGSDGAITGRIDGGGTDDGVINTIVGRDTDNYWEIGVADGAQRGSITDVTDTDDDPIGFTYLKEFTGIHSLVGGDGTDQFVYMEGGQHIALDGGGGDDNSVDFSRLGSMDVRLNIGPMADITNIQTLIGGGAGFTIGVVDGNSRWELDGEYSGVLLHDSSGDESFDAEYTFINF